MAKFKIKQQRDLSVLTDEELLSLLSKIHQNLLQSRERKYRQRKKLLKKFETDIEKEIRNRPNIVIIERPDIEINIDFPNPLHWVKNLFRNLRFH